MNLQTCKVKSLKSVSVLTFLLVSCLTVVVDLLVGKPNEGNLQSNVLRLSRYAHDDVSSVPWTARWHNYDVVQGLEGTRRQVARVGCVFRLSRLLPPFLERDSSQQTLVVRETVSEVRICF